MFSLLQTSKFAEQTVLQNGMNTSVSFQRSSNRNPDHGSDQTTRPHGPIVTESVAEREQNTRGGKFTKKQGISMKKTQIIEQLNIYYEMAIG